MQGDGAGLALLTAESLRRRSRSSCAARTPLRLSRTVCVTSPTGKTCSGVVPIELDGRTVSAN